MRHRSVLTLLIAATLLPALFSSSFSQDKRRVLNLRGEWLFEIGDVKSGEDPKLNDDKWDPIHVPGNWEDDGYPGYDGFAWYRRHVTLKSEWKDRVLYLHMGKIDDADEVYVNGHFIGFTGFFPPNFNTAYGQYREYPLPQWCLNYSGDNVIAVRVYDQEQGGGITTGDIGIYEQLDALYPHQSLSGNWKFIQGDDLRWKEPEYNDREWRTIPVPIFWETQGMKDYDGFGWYRYKFRPVQALDGQKLVLLVGKIDDLDEVYLNGEQVGKTGVIRSRGRSGSSDEYRELRAYTLPAGALNFGQDNVLAVRVFDNMFHGGIYDGPIGLVSRDAYKQWEKRNVDKKEFFWKELRDWFR